MLAYYLEQAKLADANVETRVAKEPFDFRDFDRRARPLAKGTSGVKVPPAPESINRGS